MSVRANSDLLCVKTIARAAIEAEKCLAELESAYPDVVSQLSSLMPKRRGEDGLSTSLKAQSHCQMIADIGQYKVKGIIGGGAFGVVYLAIDESLARQVALKVPRPEFMNDPGIIARFANEARLIARLKHPGVVSVYDADVSGERPFIAFEHCEGPNLADWLAQKITAANLPPSKNQSTPQTIDWRTIVKLIADIADAVHFLHQQQVIHRDIKPANLLLNPLPTCNTKKSETNFLPLSDYQIQLTDFGLAEHIKFGVHNADRSFIVGTPIYMAPEQIDCVFGQGSTERVDIYSLGIVLLELLACGTQTSVADLVAGQKHVPQKTRLDLRSCRTDVPLALEKICAGCIAESPQSRHSTAAELSRVLRACLNEEKLDHQ